MRTLTIGVVVGVTPDKWVRVWHERMPDVPLTVVPIDEADAGTALGKRADMVFARLPIANPGPDLLHTIVLWEETPVVVAARDHPVKLFDSVTLADIEGEERYPGQDDATLDIVAAGHGVAVMPQSVFRATGRRDVVARTIRDGEPTRIALVWLRDGGGEVVDEFIGIVRGRTTNSSRSASPGEPAEPAKPATATKRPDPAKRPRFPRAAKQVRRRGK